MATQTNYRVFRRLVTIVYDPIHRWFNNKQNNIKGDRNEKCKALGRR